MSYGKEDQFQYEWPDEENNDWDNADGNGDQKGENDPRVDIDNAFYEAEGNMKDRPQEAIDQFESCILMEENLEGEVIHRFKAMEHIVVLSARLKLKNKMIDFINNILKMIDKVARNLVSETINNILDATSSYLSE